MKALSDFLNDAGRYIYKASIKLTHEGYRQGKPIYQVRIEFGQEISNLLLSCYKKTWYNEVRKGKEDYERTFSELLKRQKKVLADNNKEFNKLDQAKGYCSFLKSIFIQNNINYKTITNICHEEVQYSTVTKDNVLDFLRSDSCDVRWKNKLVMELSVQDMCYSNENVKQLKRNFIRSFNYNIHKRILQLFIRFARKKNKKYFLSHLYYIKRQWWDYKDKVIDEIFRHIHDYDTYHEIIRTKEDARIASKYLRGVNITDIERKNNKKIIKTLKATDYLNETIKAKDII